MPLHGPLGSPCSTCQFRRQMSLPKSVGELASTAPLGSANGALIFGSARAALISLLSLPTISGGVLFGAPTPTQAGRLVARQETAFADICGEFPQRAAEVTASVRSLPQKSPRVRAACRP